MKSNEQKAKRHCEK